MKAHLLASTMLLGSAFFLSPARAQPPAAVTAKTQTPPLSLAELEKLIGGRTMLTLNLKDATLEEAAAAISATSGLKVQLEPKPVFTRRPGAPEDQAPPEPRYNFETKEQPFWEAFSTWQRVARAAREAEPPLPDIVLPDGRTFPRNSNKDLGLFGVQRASEGISLRPGNPLFEGRTLVNWPYLMVGTTLTRTQGGTLAEKGLAALQEPRPTGLPVAPKGAPATPPAPVTNKPPQTEAERWFDGLMFNVQAYLDPKIKPINMRCEIEEAVDDKGNDLRETSRSVSRSSTSSGPSEMGTRLTIALVSKPQMGKRLVRLRGTLRFSVVTNSQHWETTDLTTPIAGNLWRDGNDFAAQFKGLTKTTDGWDANFSAEGRGQRLRQFFDQWLSPPRTGQFNSYGIFGGSDFQVQLVDDAGQVFASNGGGLHAELRNTTQTVPATPVGPGGSPLPEDITNLVYSETTERSFPQRSNRIDQFTFTNRDRVMGRPVKLIVDLPLERREVVVPFEFTDLPLPPS